MRLIKSYFPITYLRVSVPSVAALKMTAATSAALTSLASLRSWNILPVASRKGLYSDSEGSAANSSLPTLLKLVSVQPGSMIFTLIFRVDNSKDRASLKPSSANLEAAYIDRGGEEKFSAPELIFRMRHSVL